MADRRRRREVRSSIDSTEFSANALSGEAFAPDRRSQRDTVHFLAGVPSGTLNDNRSPLNC
ncbi:MAG: hypothetical protein NTZ78_03285 [Candidatus Aureabacteria bacterium]|nr:hypothetical protein [Candidatus Auribacterota bacterium]